MEVNQSYVIPDSEISITRTTNTNLRISQGDTGEERFRLDLSIPSELLDNVDPVADPNSSIFLSHASMHAWATILMWLSALKSGTEKLQAVLLESQFIERGLAFGLSERDTTDLSIPDIQPV